MSTSPKPDRSRCERAWKSGEGARALRTEASDFLVRRGGFGYLFFKKKVEEKELKM
jgi:hypothetical protein